MKQDKSLHSQSLRDTVQGNGESTSRDLMNTEKTKLSKKIKYNAVYPWDFLTDTWDNDLGKYVNKPLKLSNYIK